MSAQDDDASSPETSSSNTANSSPPTRKYISLSHARLDALCDLYQQLIRARIAKTIVNKLEAIDIEQQHCTLLITTRDTQLQQIVKACAIWQTGQRVLRQFFFRLLRSLMSCTWKKRRFVPVSESSSAQTPLHPNRVTCSWR